MTHRDRLHPGLPAEGGFRRLVPGAGEPHHVRTDLAPAAPQPGEVLLTLAHLSDVHVCDAQSPARAEFFDRLADPDSPVRGELEEVGTYRAQEILTTQVAEAMVQAVNAVQVGPVGGGALELAIATGDNIDNAQANELDWYLALFEGGPVHPDSGDLTRYEGVCDDVMFDERYWHPESTRADLPRSRYGFPYVPGLLTAMRAPFAATGLTMPWLAVHGNHDQMLQGTVPVELGLGVGSVGDLKAVGLPPHWTAEEMVKLMMGLDDCDPAALRVLLDLEMRSITPDDRRRIISRAEFVQAHQRDGARPAGHGFDPAGCPYYRYDRGPVTMLVLDTVDEHGGYQGSLDLDQLAWLQAELRSADAEHRYVVLASHHPLGTLVNERTAPGAGRRVLAAELAAVLADHPSVVLWLNGHTHHTTVREHGSWWEVTAPSLIDWPQQGRSIELLTSPGILTIATTMLDHAGTAPWDGGIDGPLALAGLSRELAANDWQWRDGGLEEHPRAGTAQERNVLLSLPDPWA